MIQFKGCIGQTSTNAPECPSNQLCINDFQSSVFDRQSTGIYTFKSDSFLPDTRVFLPLNTTDNNAPLVHMFDGSDLRGYISVSYGYEDFGTVYIHSYNNNKELSDGIMVNFPLLIEAFQSV